MYGFLVAGVLWDTYPSRTEEEESLVISASKHPFSEEFQIHKYELLFKFPTQGGKRETTFTTGSQ